MAAGWSVKSLIRTIVLSRGYQLGSAWDPKNFEADPDNALLWRASPRRLDAEAIRDAMLAVSGHIELPPPHGSVVANVGDGYIGKGIRPEVFDITANYRSVYLPIVRDFVPDAPAIFDFAEPSLVVASRDVTNVPSQALYLMNNAFVITQSQAMAKRILAAPTEAESAPTNTSAPKPVASSPQNPVVFPKPPKHRGPRFARRSSLAPSFGICDERRPGIQGSSRERDRGTPGSTLVPSVGFVRPAKTNFAAASLQIS